jgi:hypothetical protein
MEMPRIASFLVRMYLQYVIIIVIAVFFAYILNAIFAVDDNEMRVMLSSVFLAFFAGAIVLSWRM